MSCGQHLVLADTPHIASVTNDDGGAGYTWARGTIHGGNGKGARIRPVIVDGVITEWKVKLPGYGFTCVDGFPTIEIEGDGAGAAATPVIGGGAPVYENTTKVDDWKSPSCPDYRGTVAGTGGITPEPIPLCSSGDTPGCDCVADITSIPIVPNTYALKSPPQYLDFSSCKKKVFKCSAAKKEWFGWYGFCDPAPSQVKYLKKVVTGHFIQGGDPIDAYDIVLTVTTEINRYTGLQTVTRDASGTTADIDPDTGEYVGVHTVTGGDDLAVSTHFDNLESFVEEPSECPLPEDYETIDYLPLGGAPPDPGDPCADDATYSQTETGTFSATVITHSLVNNWPHTCGAGNDLNQSASITLSSPYTPSDVVADAISLEENIDLCDDGKFPWRDDVAQLVSSPSAHYTPQLGPSYGPLVSWGADADGEPIIKGIPNPAGYEPFWDSRHLNESFQECSLGSGAYGWTTDSIGAFCPAHFGTATQWTPDNLNNLFHRGSTASFNSIPRIYQVCGDDGGVVVNVWDNGVLWRFKYAERYLFTFPHHDAARDPNGCGADAGTIDPDTVCNETPSKLFPLAAPCVGSNTSKTGSYSLKSFLYRADALQEPMNCTPGNVSINTCMVAIFIQDQALTGIYATIGIRFDAATISYFDERIIDDVPQGDWALKQFWQAMIDPLWKAPATCVEGVVTPDADPTVPYEENDDCVRVDCGSNPDDPRCLPGDPLSSEEIDLGEV